MSFRFIDSDFTGGTPGSGNLYRGICKLGNYIHVAGLDYVRAYTFDGNLLSCRGLLTSAPAANASAIYGYGTYLHIADGVSGVSSYTFNGTNYFLVKSSAHSGVYIDIAGNENTLYLARNTVGLSAYAWDGANHTLVDTETDIDPYWVIYSNNYIYAFSVSSDIAIYTFDGAAFTRVGLQMGENNIHIPSVYNNRIFVPDTDTNTVYVYSFDGATISLVNSIAHSDPAVGVASTYARDDMLFIGLMTGLTTLTLIAYRYYYNNDTYREIGRVNVASLTAVTGYFKSFDDGTYLFSCADQNGLNVFELPTRYPRAAFSVSPSSGKWPLEATLTDESEEFFA